MVPGIILPGCNTYRMEKREGLYHMLSSLALTHSTVLGFLLKQYF